MKTLLFFLLGLFTFVYPQVVQVTNIHGNNCSNFTSVPYPNTEGYFAFEAKGGTISDIFLGKYNGNSNTFALVKNVTNYEGVNTNPVLFMHHDTLYIVYQSIIDNISRIVYRTYTNGSLSDYQIIGGNLPYSTKPGLLNNGHAVNDSNYVYFEAGNSIYLKRMPSNDEPLEIFSGDMDVQYSSPSFYSTGFEMYAAVRMKGFNTEGYFIQLKKRTGYDWGSVRTLFSGKEFDNIRFVKVDYTMMLSWDVTVDNRKDIYLLSNPEDTTSIVALRDNYPYSNFDFHADQNTIITDNNYLPVIYSNAFKVLMNDSLYIRVNKPDTVFNAEDTLIYSAVNNSSLYVGCLGYSQGGIVFYTVWESKSGDDIQLFGKRSIEYVTGVNEDNPVPSQFTLLQNYPNPFNPSTKIRWNMKSGENVSLVVYDMLGREVRTLVNEYKPSGQYEVEFNASGLSSGVYYYKLTAGGSASIKKLIYMK